MEKMIKMLGIVALTALIVLGMAGCDNSTGGGGSYVKTYSIYGSGVTSAEWSANLGSLSPDDLIDESSTWSSSDVNAAFADLKADTAGNQIRYQTESQVRNTLELYAGGSLTNVDQIMDKLTQQGWVIFATTIGVGSGDYANIIGIK